jgi:hypothetical protein
MNYYNYFTEIEEHFIRRRGKHLMIAPLDWHLIAAWKSSGIPLNVALRGIDIAMDSWESKRSRIGDRLSSLAYCHDSVMQEYARHIESHIGEAASSAIGESRPKEAEEECSRPGSMEKDGVLGLIEKRISEIKAARGKQLPVEAFEGMDRAVERLVEIGRLLESSAPDSDFEIIERDMGILDAILVDALRKAVPDQETAKWEQDGKKDLKTYKKRLPKDVFEKIRADYMREKVRRFYQIGELSLYHL